MKGILSIIPQEQRGCKSPSCDLLTGDFVGAGLQNGPERHLRDVASAAPYDILSVELRRGRTPVSAFHLAKSAC